jgi:hypothetical protein
VKDSWEHLGGEEIEVGTPFSSADVSILEKEQKADEKSFGEWHLRGISHLARQVHRKDHLAQK